MNQSLLYELNQVMSESSQTGLFSTTASFFDRPGTVDALGQVDLTNLVPVTELQSIPCQISAVSIIRPQFQGARQPEQIIEQPERHILLNDYYPAILQRFIVQVDGQNYEITPGGVEPDSQKQMTRLAVRFWQQ